MHLMRKIVFCIVVNTKNGGAIDFADFLIQIFIFIVTIIIAVMALVFVFLPKYIDYIVRSHDGYLQIVENRKKLLYSQEVINTSMREMSSLLKFYGAVIVRIINNINIKKSDKISSEIGDYDYSIEKSIYEMNLFSDNEILRQSAVRSLCEDYGDLKSLELMEKCYNEVYIDDKDLKVGIAVLRDRIQYKLLSS